MIPSSKFVFSVLFASFVNNEIVSKLSHSKIVTLGGIENFITKSK